MSKEVVIQGGNFEAEVKSSAVPVLVDFFATWCGPCKQLAPVLSRLAEDYDGKLKVAKVDTDVNPDLAANFSIRGVPTLIFFKGGQEVSRVVGYRPFEELKGVVDGLV